jgi:hypothetical protein
MLLHDRVPILNKTGRRQDELVWNIHNRRPIRQASSARLAGTTGPVSHRSNGQPVPR